MCTTLLTLVVLLAAAPPVTSADEFRDVVTGIDFPATLGSLERIDLTRYQTAEMGFSVRYSGPNLLKTDVYVYTGGVAELGTGNNGEAVQQHFADVKQGVFLMQEKGRYLDVKLASEGEVTWNTPAGSLPVQHAVMRYSQVNQDSPEFADPCISHIYLGTYKDHFVKIRFTYRAKYRNQGDDQLRRFVQEFVQLLK